MILNNTSVSIEQDYPVVIPFKVIQNNSTKKEVKYNKDGSIRQTKNNKIAGESSEVYAFRTKEEIDSIMNVLDKHITEAPDYTMEKIVNINDKSFQTRSDMSNSNWLNKDWVVVPDNSELANKIMQLFPRFDLVFDEYSSNGGHK